MIKDNFNDIPGRKRELIARLANSGIDDLDDVDIAELLLYYAGCRKSVRATAQALIEKFGSVTDVFCADARMLSGFGLSESAVVLAKLIYDIYPDFEAAGMERKENVLSPDDLKRMFRMRFVGCRTEQLYVICFDKELSVRSVHRVSKGIASFSEVDINDLVMLLLEKNTSAAAIGHNHPNSGSLPSPEDIAFTNRIAALMNDLNITFLDHIITGERSSYSFRENGDISIFL